MKQIFQNLKTGDTILADMPCPRLQPGHVLIRTAVSLISPGTERMLLQFGKAGLLSKARQQPDKVRQVLDKVKTDGLLPTIEAVRAKLEQLVPLGYCNVGTVVAIGAGVTNFRPGDRVASNGNHAEMVAVPANLCARIPDGVSDDMAAFTIVGAIALQGIRLAEPTLGESVVVMGLGLVGLLTAQLLKAQGCRVLGLDFDPARIALAQSFGAEAILLAPGIDPVAAANAFSRGRGIDAVIVAAATASNEPIHQAAQMCRKRGRIVLVGVTGLELARSDFYEKELSFQVSCSYGPGRYDPSYENEGHDYPLGFVRWTAQRNFEAVLDMMEAGGLDATPLVSHRFPVAAFDEAYAALGDAKPLGIVIEFPSLEAPATEQLLGKSVTVTQIAAPATPKSMPGIAFIGAGPYASRVLMPAFAARRCTLRSVVSNGGVNALQAARKFGIGTVTTDTEAAIKAPEIDVVVVATRHDSHARLAIEALRHGRHVFVEKPLCLTETELREIKTGYHSADGCLLMVGFNRRFAPHVVRMKQLLAGSIQPKAIVITVNAGSMPADHWVHDAKAGGGRILGEACHFIDLARFLAGSPIASVTATGMGAAGDRQMPSDRATISLKFADGSLATVIYLSNGHRAYPKERVEVFCDGRVLQLDNFRVLRGHGWSGFRTLRLWRQDKGNAACVSAFLTALAAGGPAPIPAQELFEVAQATLDAVAQLSG